jgi:hypothetical protein
MELRRVHEVAFLGEPEAEVRARREAGGPHLAEHLLLAHALADAQTRREAPEVCVVRDVAVHVADLHQVAEAALPALEDHLAVPHRPDRGAVGRGVVDAEVGTPDLEDRVQARLGEGRADAGEVERRLQELALDGRAVGPVVGAATARRLEVDRAELLVVGRVARREDLAGARVGFAAFLVHGEEALVEDRELVAAVDAAGEVGPGEDLGEVLGEPAARRASIACSRPELTTPARRLAPHDPPGARRAAALAIS